jgi:spore coat polysaccharide biosynthesis protein SpsF
MQRSEIMARPRVAAIVQARMKSTRLPGKVLKDIAGAPLLWHVLHRLRACTTVDVIAVATSTDPADDVLESYCRDQGVLCVRGPEDHVLHRYAMAAEACQADVIVRVTSDAPLIDPGFVDYLIRGLIDNDADFVTMAGGAIVAHEGADPFSRRALDKLARDAWNDPIAKEHVSAYFKAHPDFVRIAQLPAPEWLKFSGARLSIDTPADAAFLTSVYERLNARAGEASLSDLIALLRRDPSLLRINAHVAQKGASQMAGTILMRCDGGGSLGFGHVKRSLALARSLRDRHGFGVAFAMGADQDTQALAEREGFPIHLWPKDRNEADWLSGVIAQTRPLAVLFDTRVTGGAAAVRAARKAGCLTAVVDDASERRLDADLAFYPPVPQAARLEWRGAQTQRFTGWDWAILGAAPLPYRPRAEGSALNVLVTMGGSDPQGQTVPAARALARILGTHRVTVTVGKGFPGRVETLRSLRQLPGPMTILDGAEDLRPAMAEAEMAVSMFGVTAYELAAHGVPALYLTLTDDHARSAQAFVDAGLGRLIGPSGCGETPIAEAARVLLSDPQARANMAAAGLRTVDGRGAERIAAMVAERLQTAGLRKAG